jgi:hypothetical protein
MTLNTSATVQPISSCALPPKAWRQVMVTDTRTVIDYAHQVNFLVDKVFPDAIAIRIV